MTVHLFSSPVFLCVLLYESVGLAEKFKRGSKLNKECVRDFYLEMGLMFGFFLVSARSGRDSFFSFSVSYSTSSHCQSLPVPFPRGC